MENKTGLVSLCCFLTIVPHVLLGAIEISKEPVAVCYNPNSILNGGYDHYAQQVGSRTRLSTCTGVAWFSGGQQLISANLLESSFQIYAFNSSTEQLTPVKSWKQTRITQLGWPENLCISKDEKWLAVTNSYTGKVNLYRVNKHTGVNPAVVGTVFAGDTGLHGVRFSSHGDFLSYVTYDNPPKIRVFRIDQSGQNPRLDLTYTYSFQFDEMAAKGIAFSPDDHYVAICFAKRATSQVAARSGRIVIYRFDRWEGTLDPIPVSEIGVEEGLNVPEDIAFYPDGSCILASNQGGDSVSLHIFDSQTGMIGPSSVALQSPEAELNFPHGIAISPDGKYLAVSNYGDDKITIYKITNTN